MKETDILIVGAGPAGLSAGIAAAKHGAKVLVIDENRKLDLVFDTDPASDKGGSSAATKRQ